MPDLNVNYDDIDDGFGERYDKPFIGCDPSYLARPQYMIGDDVFTPNKRFCNLTSEAKRIATEDYGFTEESYNAIYAPDRPRFSITHITKVFKEVYDMEVVNYGGGYKAGRGRRFTPYRLRYSNGDYVRDPATNEILTFTIPQMGQFLKNNGDY